MHGLTLFANGDDKNVDFPALCKIMSSVYQEDPYEFRFDILLCFQLDLFDDSEADSECSLTYISEFTFPLIIQCMKHTIIQRGKSMCRATDDYFLLYNETLPLLWLNVTKVPSLKTRCQTDIAKIMYCHIGCWLDRIQDPEFDILSARSNRVICSFFSFIWHLAKMCSTSANRNDSNPCIKAIHGYLMKLLANVDMVRMAQDLTKHLLKVMNLNDHVNGVLEGCLLLMSKYLYMVDTDQCDCRSLYPICLQSYLDCVQTIVAKVKISNCDRNTLSSKFILSYSLSYFLTAVRDFYFRDCKNATDKVNFIRQSETVLLGDPAIYNRDYKTLQLEMYTDEGSFPRLFIQSNTWTNAKLSLNDMFTTVLLRQAPFLVYLGRRLEMIEKIARVHHTPSTPAHHGEQPIAIRRNHIYEDGLLSYTNNPTLSLYKEPHVVMVNQYGLEEYGVDGGGILREFHNLFMQEALNPRRGLFKYTSLQTVIPDKIGSRGYINDFISIGRVMAKMIIEGHTCDVPISENFLEILMRNIRSHCARFSRDPEFRNSKYKAACLMHDEMMELGEWICDPSENFRIKQLLGVDDDLYYGLSSLCTMTDDQLSEIGINMADYVEGEQDGILCKKVRKTNVLHSFVHKMVKNVLYDSMIQQSNAICLGMSHVLGTKPFQMLQVFNPDEFQILINGRAITTLDCIEWRECANYTGAYHSEHPVIILFWDVLNNFTNEERRLLLKFVTSSDRLPMSGFAGLNPPFTVGDFGRDTERWPTAQTCINALGLPPYENKHIMRTRLLQSIRAQSGFELA
ncbi:hypothetical protein ACOME3_008571 [Neoechinorhynchus agilis]